MSKPVPSTGTVVHKGAEAEREDRPAHAADPLGLDRGMERAEQARAMDAEAGEAGADRVVTNIEDAPAAGMGQAEKAVDPCARAPDAVAEAKPVEDGEAERLEEEARADRPRRLE